MRLFNPVNAGLLDDSNEAFGTAVVLDGEVTFIGDTSAGNDLTGTTGVDIIEARAGDDVVFAGAGDDVVNAGGGDDIVNAGGGNDQVFGLSLIHI